MAVPNMFRCSLCNLCFLNITPCPAERQAGFCNFVSCNLKIVLQPAAEQPHGTAERGVDTSGGFSDGSCRHESVCRCWPGVFSWHVKLHCLCGRVHTKSIKTPQLHADKGKLYTLFPCERIVLPDTAGSEEPCVRRITNVVPVHATHLVSTMRVFTSCWYKRYFC